MECYKAWTLVLGDKGFTQVKGLNSPETFVPVAKLVSIQVFLLVVVAWGWELHQKDVNNAFLHGDLEEEVYMKLTPDFRTIGKDRVYQLHKSIFVLQQAFHNWFNKLKGSLMALLNLWWIIHYLPIIKMAFS